MKPVVKRGHEGSWRVAPQELNELDPGFIRIAEVVESQVLELEAQSVVGTFGSALEACMVLWGLSLPALLVVPDHDELCRWKNGMFF